jgi:hypothetical protein
MWLMGGFAEFRRKNLTQTEDAPNEQAPAEHPFAFLKSLKSWGIILILSAGLLLTFSVYTPVKAGPLSPTVHRVTNNIPTISFPAMELQGITVNGSKSSALINGRVLFIGEGIGNTRIVAIEPEHVRLTK